MVFADVYFISLFVYAKTVSFTITIDKHLSFNWFDNLACAFVLVALGTLSVRTLGTHIWSCGYIARNQTGLRAAVLVQRHWAVATCSPNRLCRTLQYVKFLAVYSFYFLMLVFYFIWIYNMSLY